ncbi:MAG: cation diffusion facilitator family transporter [Bacteroidia bacterium]
MTSSSSTWLSRPERYFRLALGGAIIGLLCKGLAYWAAGTAGFLADATESLLNTFTALLGWYASWWAQRPRDRDHPYGHGKADALISSFQGLLIIATTGGLLYLILAGHYRALQPEGVTEALLAQGSALSLNTLLALLLWKGSQRFQSQALLAESIHLAGDAGTSVIALINLLLLYSGAPLWLDKVIGVALAAAIVYGAFRVLRRTLANLVDTQDPALLEKIVQILDRHRRPEWIDIHNVRIQRYGAALHVDGHVTLPWYWDLARAHEAMKALEEAIRKELGEPIEFFWHMDPCEPICCPFCEVLDCAHRVAVFRERLPLRAERLFVNAKRAWQEE